MMIKVSVMYPNGPDARFDATYYRERHMPMVQACMGEHCKYFTIDYASTDAGPGNTPYLAMGHLYCDSVAAFQAGFGPHAAQIMADIPNFTNQTPLIQMSEILVG